MCNSILKELSFRIRPKSVSFLTVEKPDIAFILNFKKDMIIIGLQSSTTFYSINDHNLEIIFTGHSSGNNCYQYQLQSMWQKCWSQNAAMAHGIRYRERGPLKSWRPETMADAIWAVLQEGLSLSQAARKNDIPYPTFVLYANRVHNMLGPSLTDTSPALGGW